MKIVLVDNRNDIFSRFKKDRGLKFFKVIDYHIKDIASTY